MIEDDPTIDHPFLERGMALAADWMQPLAADRCLGISTGCAAAVEALLACCIAAVAVICTGQPTDMLQNVFAC